MSGCPTCGGTVDNPIRASQPTYPPCADPFHNRKPSERCGGTGTVKTQPPLLTRDRPCPGCEDCKPSDSPTEGPSMDRKKPLEARLQDKALTTVERILCGGKPGEPKRLLTQPKGAAASGMLWKTCTGCEDCKPSDSPTEAPA